MAYPHFHHIHCSSRFDRSPASLEADIDDWITRASIITMTEVSNDRRAAQMSEVGFGYHYAKGPNPGDDGGIMWELAKWHLKQKFNVHISTIPIPHGTVMAEQWFVAVLLRRKDSGHTLLVCVTHMPAHVQGHGGPHWAGAGQAWDSHWKARKAAYMQAMTNFSAYVRKLAAKHNPDAVLVSADWNLNLKLDWVRNYFRDHWGKTYRQAWTRFPTSGGSLHGQQVVPLGAPGKGHGDSIIDGSLYHGLEVTLDPNLMAAVRSSDHRPYREAFTYNHAAGKASNDAAPVSASGDTKPGPAWWGFGDYLDDEFYEVDDGGVPYYPDLYVKVGGSAGGEVL